MRDLIGWEPTSRDFRVASARIRCLNPILQLQAEKFPVELFDPAHGDRYAAVVFSKRYDYQTLRQAEGLAHEGVRVLFDLCDNRFYAPKAAPERSGELDRLNAMLKLAREVIVSTEALAGIVKTNLQSPRPLSIIGDAVETEIRGTQGSVFFRGLHRWGCRKLLKLLEELRRKGLTRLVWFGHHGSGYADGGMADLDRIKQSVEQAHSRKPVSLTVISNNPSKFQSLVAPWRIPAFYLPWHPATFFAALRAHDVAVLPIQQSDFTRCKTNNRPATALASGLAVIADSIPSYEPLRFATVLDNWEGGWDRYLGAPEKRRQDAAAGREFVLREYAIERIAGQWKALFERMLKS